MIVAVGCDHNGVELKQALCEELAAQGVEVRDLTPEDRSGIDYPDPALGVAQAVANHEADRGVLVCGTGIGMSITANKVSGVRAALCADPYTARMSRMHNDANVLCLGGLTMGRGPAVEVLKAWLAAEPSTEERHVRRRAKVQQIERSPSAGA